MSTTYALIATVSFHDTVVEQRHVPRGRPLEIGRDESLAVPLPAGVPYLARCSWRGPDKVGVVDGRGRTYLVEPDAPVELTLGPVTLNVSLAAQFSLKRTVRLDTVLSIAWLAIVLMGTNTMSAAYLVHENWCPWVGVDVGFMGLYCTPPEGTGGIDVTAEYLARLLREDYAGDEEGYLVKEIDRPDAEKESNDFYMPAGNEGPIDDMGGAEETSPDPVRTPEEEEQPPLPIDGGEIQPLYADDVGVPIDAPAEDDSEDVGDDGIVEVDEPEEIDALEAPSEEERGWGIRDWYDEEDATLDHLEIDMMIDSAKRVLKIDPDDPSALSILSYYQYLAQDYDAALDTYDRFIALYPDNAAGYNNKALVYKRQGDYEIEERLYRVALALEPGDVTAMNNLAVNLAHQGRHAEGLALMQELETLDPDEPYADLHRAKIYAEMGDDKQALFYLDKALQGMKALDTLHHIEFRQDIRVDPSFAKLRETRAFRDVLVKYYGEEDSPLQEG